MAEWTEYRAQPWKLVGFGAETAHPKAWFIAGIHTEPLHPEQASENHPGETGGPAQERSGEELHHAPPDPPVGGSGITTGDELHHAPPDGTPLAVQHSGEGDELHYAPPDETPPAVQRSGEEPHHTSTPHLSETQESRREMSCTTHRPTGPPAHDEPFGTTP